MEYYEMVEEIIFQLGFVPSITYMIKEINERKGLRPSRTAVHTAYKTLVTRGLIKETGMNPVWVLPICQKCYTVIA